MNVAAETGHAKKKEFMSSRRVQHGTTAIATFEVAARFPARPYVENDHLDLVGTISAERATLVPSRHFT